MRVFYTKASKDDLSGLSPDIRERIQDKVDHYAQTPNPLVFAKRLHNDPEATHRYEIGDWRVKFDVKGTLLVIKRVRHRSDPVVEPLPADQVVDVGRERRVPPVTSL